MKNDSDDENDYEWNQNSSEPLKDDRDQVFYFSLLHLKMKSIQYFSLVN